MLLICGDDEAHKEMEDDGGHATGRPQGWRWWSN